MTRRYREDFDRTNIFLPAEEIAKVAALARTLRITQSEVFRLGVRVLQDQGVDRLKAHLEPKSDRKNQLRPEPAGRP
jgi:hypothetical protein